MKAIDIKASRASDLLKEMVEYGIIEPVTGHGKGKYRFRQH
jgi:Fic family protein